MKLPKKIIQKYNQKDALLVISTYPKQGEIYSKDVDAVAPYTKNTILGIKKNNPTQKIVVLAPCIKATDSFSFYEEDGVLVVRCFQRNDVLSFANIIKLAKTFTAIASVLVAFEFSSFGDTKSTLALPFLLSALALMGKRLSLVLHQVVLDLSTLSGHIGVTKNGVKTKFMSWFLRKYYALLCAPVQSVIVLEDEIKKRLSSLVNAKKIHVSYHGVDASKAVKNADQEAARKKLGITNDEFVLVYFGYITWYKGADFFIEALKNKKQLGKKKLRVILAGGPSATQNQKVHYQKFFQKVAGLVAANKHVSLTGFVEEKDLKTYLAASDLLVFPYRTFMSSSGALATAFAFQKPFIVSEKLKKYFASHDMAALLSSLGISFTDISFALTEKSLWDRIQKVSQKEMYSKLLLLSRGI